MTSLQPVELEYLNRYLTSLSIANMQGVGADLFTRGQWCKMAFFRGEISWLEQQKAAFTGNPEVSAETSQRLVVAIQGAIGHLQQTPGLLEKRSSMRDKKLTPHG